jgi:hypothetical protein
MKTNFQKNKSPFLHKATTCIAALGLLLLSSACQEITVNLEYAEMADREAVTHPSDQPPLSPDSPTAGPIDPSLYFFPDEALPQDVAFSSEALTSYYISYLPGPNKMMGAAFARRYNAYYQNFEVQQIIIQSPYSIPLDMFNAGHSGEVLDLPPEGYSLGQGTLVNSMQEGSWREVRYRFYQNNIMVIVQMQGLDDFVSLENAYQLAGIIAAQLPESFPTVESLTTLPLEVEPGLADTYFKGLSLRDCGPSGKLITNLSSSLDGICIKVDVLKPIQDFKVGVYSENYQQVIFIKEYLLPAQLGRWDPQVVEGIWDFAWNEFPDGEYRLMIWVNDRLAAAVPFSIGLPE